MNKELSDALRQFADRLERGEFIAGAQAIALVVTDNVGKVSSSYIGRHTPPDPALIDLLACGIRQTLAKQTTITATHGSTH